MVSDVTLPAKSRGPGRIYQGTQQWKKKIISCSLRIYSGGFRINELQQEKGKGEKKRLLT